MSSSRSIRSRPTSAAAGVTARERVPRGHKMAIIACRRRASRCGNTAKRSDLRRSRSRPATGCMSRTSRCAISPATIDLPRALRTTRSCRQSCVRPSKATSRPNGKVGTRNYIGILTSVNCSASVAKFIAEEVNRSGILDDHPEIDGAVAFVHGSGCGMAAYGEGWELLRRTQWGYATHPNLGAALMVGLGCEVFQIDRMKDEYGMVEGDHFQTMTIQATGGTQKTVDQGLAAHQSDAAGRRRAQGERRGRPRDRARASVRRIGRLFRNHCKPCIGRCRRSSGQTWRNSGARRNAGNLRRRAFAHAARNQSRCRAKSWSSASGGGRTIHKRNGGEMNNNPAPGNKAGGLTTILEKSLGAAAKGGTTTLRAVYEYAEPVKEKGFVFMDTPGYDPVGATGQVAGGCNVMCFTTGRGSAFGCKPTPSIKLATNTEMYRRMTDDMDINCGDVLDGTSIEAKGQEIFEKMLQVASGTHTKSEELGYGELEFVPWQIGAVM